jgi:hypothetical protein
MSQNAFVKGLRVSVLGFIRRVALRDPVVHENYWTFIKKTYVPVLLIIYAIAMVLALIFFPITIAVIIFTPAICYQFLTVAPIWALYFAEMYNPVSSDRLFLASLRSIDASLASRFEIETEKWSKQPISWYSLIRGSIWEQLYFTLCLILCFVLGFIPFIGIPLSWIVYTYMVSQMLAWRLLDVYMSNICHMSEKMQNKFMQENRMLLIGFCTPYVALTAVPIAGPLLLGYAKASVADLFYEEIYKDHKIIADIESGNHEVKLD